MSFVDFKKDTRIFGCLCNPTVDRFTKLLYFSFGSKNVSKLERVLLKMTFYCCGQRALAITADRDKIYTLVEEHESLLVELTFSQSTMEWGITRVYEGNEDDLIQLQFSQDEKHVVGTFMFGFKVRKSSPATYKILLIRINLIRLSKLESLDNYGGFVGLELGERSNGDMFTTRRH